MAFLRVDTVHLFEPLRLALLELMRSMTDDDWNRATVCPGWSARDVGLHLLGVEMHNVSRRRDGYVAPFPETATEDKTRLALFNDGWVESARGMSPRMLCGMLDYCSSEFVSYVNTINLDSPSEVAWACTGDVPAWLDVAREYTERWVHQQQIREAVQRPGMTELRYLQPVVAAFVHAYPMALKDVAAPNGTKVEVVVTGGAGGAWHVVMHEGKWDLRAGSGESQAACVLETDADNFWRLMTQHPLATNPAVRGDKVLGQALASAVAIML